MELRFRGVAGSGKINGVKIVITGGTYCFRFVTCWWCFLGLVVSGLFLPICEAFAYLWGFLRFFFLRFWAYKGAPEDVEQPLLARFWRDPK